MDNVENSKALTVKFVKVVDSTLLPVGGLDLPRLMCVPSATVI